MKSNNPLKFILSGGGTGGHIFPAVAIANALKQRFPNAEFLFVGALGKMEMEKVPKEGYDIVGLPIEGLKRSLSPRNLLVFFKTLQSFWRAKKILNTFKPDVVIGTGGYASLPICYVSSLMRIPTLLQEQNGFAGLTNRLVSGRAARICTGFPQMDNFFPKGNWEFTGNPVRQNIIELANKTTTENKHKVKQQFGLQPDLPVVFVTGGSLGARTINEAIFTGMTVLAEAGVQVIWQMGLPFAKSHRDAIDSKIKENATLFLGERSPRIFHAPFIYDMDDAYMASDVVISRAGAISISEIAIVGKPSVLVPSPNVTDDHQTKNARVLSDLGAAILVSDKEANDKLIEETLALLKDTNKQAEMQMKLKDIAKPQATETIVKVIVECIGKRG